MGILSASNRRLNSVVSQRGKVTSSVRESRENITQTIDCVSCANVNTYETQ